jgi:acyl-coenzyme A synthetase/AMP-(fatty) acid ligase/aryl carrier-like protein
MENNGHFLKNQSIHLSSENTFRQSQDFQLPEIFSGWCKGNINNGKVLFISIVRELLYAHSIPISLVIQHDRTLISIPTTGLGDFREGAKTIMTGLKSHVVSPNQYQASLDSGIIVAQTLDPYLYPIAFCLSEDLKGFQVFYSPEFAQFTQDLSLCIVDSILPKDDSLAGKLLDSGASIVQQSLEKTQRKTSALHEAWDSIFEQPLDWNKSYFSNGGDSIQAIRLLSKIRSLGFEGDFGSLLNAPSVLLWDLKETVNAPETSFQPLRFPLTIMQEKIWTQRAASASGIYHEQFLFKLSQSPEPAVLEQAFQKIWTAYPQLRIIVEQEHHLWFQEVHDWEADFRDLGSVDSVDTILTNDLEEGFPSQLMRCQFFRCLGANYLLWSHHHVLLDGWSVGLLIQQFIEGLDTDEKPIIQPNFQYLVHQKEQALGSLPMAEKTAFFKELTPLHFNKQRSALTGFAEMEITRDFSGLTTFCSREGMTPQQVFLGALSMANFALTGQHQSYIHGISSGRSLLPEFAETAIGLFIKNVLIGWNWQPEDNLGTICRKVIEGQQLGLSLEHAPIEASENMEIPDVLFVYENYPYNQVKGQRISGNLVYNLERTGYAMTLLIMPDGDHYQFKAIYQKELFNEAYVAYFLDQVASMVERIQRDIDQPLVTFEPSIEPEQAKEFPLWTEVVDEVLEQTKSSIFDASSEAFLAIADTPSWVYRLNEVLSGATKGSRIGIYGEKNHWTPCIIYAIMRCGYSYVPLNPSWPEDRIQQVLSMANCTMILGPNPQMPISVDIPYLAFENIALSLENRNLPELGMEDEAYVLFTSGSTGMPKGVKLSHKNLSAFFHACKDHVNPTAFDHLFSITNLGFDLSLFENLYGLYIGKSVVVVGDILQLERAIERFPKGLLNTVPSLLSRLEAHEIKHLSVVHSAGEPFTESLWNHLKSTNPSLIVKNWYGPTETTTYSTIVDLSEEYHPTIGRALKHETVHICNALLREVPEGIVGEIVIGGDGVALGYIDTQGGFFEHNGRSYYRTGDFGVKRQGTITLIGRNDRQVKRLGQRFELHEIEQSVSQAFHEIKRIRYCFHAHSFVLFIEHSDERLKENIQRFLVQKFPAYMRPDALVLMEKFPENSNGKIDELSMLRTYEREKSLTLNPDQSASALLLKLKELPLFETLNGSYGFIEQGGDSILGLRLIGKLNTWGYGAGINDLLNAASLDTFFQALEMENKPVSSHDELELTPIQAWFLEEYKGNKNHFNQSILLEINVPIPLETMGSLVNESLAAFPILRQVYRSGWQPGIHPMVTVEALATTEEITLVCERIQSSFDLTQGPVAGAAVLSVGEQTYLFIAMHHFYCDGFSWRIILDELKERLQGRGMRYEGPSIFAQVQFAIKKLSPFVSKTWFNPWEDWSPCSYQKSRYITLDWEMDRTETFLRKWEAERHVNEKILFFVMGAWGEHALPMVTPMMETHGRSYDSIPGLAESLGWFTQFYPVPIQEHVPVDQLLEHLHAVSKEISPHQLAYMGTEGYAKPCYPLLINFLGSFDENWGGLARPSSISQGSMVDLENSMLAHVEINALIVEGKLRWMFRSHPNFELTSYCDAFEQFSQKYLAMHLGHRPHIDLSIDEDDLHAIDDLLNDL